MFTINGHKASEYKAELIDRTISSSEVITIDDWLDNAIQPTFVRQQEKFKQIDLVVLLKATSEDEAQILFSKLTAELKYGELKFDDLSLSYKVTLDGVASPDRLRSGFYEITYSLKAAYGMAAETSISRSNDTETSFTINNTGTGQTPCIIEITPSIAISSLTFEGFSDKAFTVKNLVKDQKVIINGENNSILMNGKNGFANFDGWSFPRLKPGKNALKVSSSLGYTMIIKYKARYI